jgi:hypothetical protein
MKRIIPALERSDSCGWSRGDHVSDKACAILSDERIENGQNGIGQWIARNHRQSLRFGRGALRRWRWNIRKEDLPGGFNYQYLLDFLQTTDEPEITSEFKDSESAAQLLAQPAGDYNYRYVSCRCGSDHRGNPHQDIVIKSRITTRHRSFSSEP